MYLYQTNIVAHLRVLTLQHGISNFQAVIAI